MKKLMLLLVLTPMLLVLSCVAPQYAEPSESDLVNGDYGSPPENYEPTIRASLEKSLFDYDSAKINFKKPRRTWRNISKKTRFGKPTFQYLWKVPVEVNAKNRFGAYVGWKTWYYYFKDGVFVTVKKY